MQYPFIEIRGARENNLKNVSLRIPRNCITVLTGVSGSGKSSIAFETIGAEAQRQLNETFTTFVQNFLPRAKKPEADAIENISTAIIINQQRLGGNSRSTVGTITDIYSLIRLLYSRVGKPHAGYSNAFSFNDPAGMCPVCNGLGRKVEANREKLFNRSLSLNEGGITFPAFAVDSWYWKSWAQSGLFDLDKKLENYTEKEWELLLFGKEPEGVIEKFNRLYIKRDTSSLAESTISSLEQYMNYAHCDACNGTRLNQAALNCRINGRNIAELAAMEISELIENIRAIDDPTAATLVPAIADRLQHMIDIGLEYLSLNRETSSLSGGESQRIKMVRHLGSSLTETIYIFDEPSIGLHPRDVHRLNEMLRKLCDKGNTLIVVEHDPEVIRTADHIIDVGPHAGTRGGEIVYEGNFEGLLQSGTLTAKYMNRNLPLKMKYREANGHITLQNANRHNLKNITVQIPTGIFTVITGVAGSGKSSLINGELLERLPEAISIDQSAVSTNIRSNPATYTGIMDEIRRLFAKANNVSPSLFSYNSKGACPDCSGLGFIYTDLAFMEAIRSPCETCSGKRFSTEVLNYKLNGSSITDVLEMTVYQALHFFEKKELKKRLKAIHDVGLDYLTLGQPLSTLSGGECQRIKLAGELHKQGSVYVLDEPTTGLHMSDVGHLLRIIDSLVDGGNTVIVIEHNVDVIRNADWIIDLGPEGGRRGGEVVFEGRPKDIVHAEHSLTGKFLGA
ncbi:ATP-binding cassette domain-containing protein [Pseudobacter ginsenosidimutans]|uniref:UvrABC system protein A n=1 Tax=Pseudobacter ginsenosidimutans TaxID=661488 RepID=A0A4Q7MLF8_9BACT|nr:excinuclease ABC subunit UvrA [Pseudobacter ginsenosidimutans]QEC45781.1 excinuclease ABC subunit UvrA [Pseudobacter ginsenosidimutans]RZS69271.1 excinuclease ABC A subunit [Pseudobacter ginsenosidimutans]